MDYNITMVEIDASEPIELSFKQELAMKALFRQVDYLLDKVLKENGYKGIFK